MPLTNEEIIALLKPPVPKRQTPPQVGPLRYYDREMKCLSRNCSSPTYIKIEGVAYCMTHALHALNNLVVQMTEQRFEVVRGGGGTA